ncbi:hypothetical protein CDL15_Pgr010967 [Punica granatum]|uniref:Uncharacterized protein n=1 Tax=Punica granatum TaxID=22663 RepID=A0A218XMH0_PUNGR|nr:hypothetical protein CDL15_Pgr010967 [Punica granatum]
MGRTGWVRGDSRLCSLPFLVDEKDGSLPPEMVQARVGGMDAGLEKAWVGGIDAGLEKARGLEEMMP